MRVRVRVLGRELLAIDTGDHDTPNGPAFSAAIGEHLSAETPALHRMGFTLPAMDESETDQ